MTIDEKLTVRELYTDNILIPMRGNWISSVNDQWIKQAMDKSLSDIHNQNLTWAVQDMLKGINRTLDIASSGRQFVFPVYAEAEICKHPEKAQAKLIYFPAETKQEEHFILLLAGGGYGAVCSLPEAIPAAAELNSFGYSCFCLNYRTASQESFEKGLMPKPLEDIAAALNFISGHSRLFCVNPEKYFLGGFSAGGHAAAMWGTAHRGARFYSLPQAKGLLLAYPMISSSVFPESPMTVWIKQGMYGRDYTETDEQSYAVDRHIDPEYPSVYLVRAADDITVAADHHLKLIRALNREGVPVCLEEADHGGHDFGTGSDTLLKGWLQRAVEFLIRAEKDQPLLRHSD